MNCPKCQSSYLGESTGYFLFTCGTKFYQEENIFVRTESCMDRQAQNLNNTILLLITTPHIRNYLQLNDLKALEQAERAVNFNIKDYPGFMSYPRA